MGRIKIPSRRIFFSSVLAEMGGIERTKEPT